MKIQGERPDEIAATQTVSSGRSARTETAGLAAAPAEDRLDVSSDARLLNTAVQAANDAPEIRHDLVERARQMLDNGTLGSDLNRLADRMIDHMMRP
jgi:flagellar biosynthesis anti-sigma factor FlgM